jgi:SHS2 domain-containing protein
MMSGYEFEEHIGELRLRLSAASRAELFVEAGRALAELFCGSDRLPQAAGERVPVELESSDQAGLLVDWMNELIFQSETKQTVFVEFDLRELGERDLRASIRGANVSELRTLVKAATLHDLRVSEQEHGVSATVVLDV